uniref:Uncharacterized protein n=1 Tax=Tanacetum cinerariifolium TaxID=118510 RepID=A0A6L2KHH4_TANCI|nr:hypothetical protein [Tanacetum cinerariifolium]
MESSAPAAFMVNSMQTGPSTGQGSSNDTDFHSEVQTYDNHFFDNMNLQVSQEMHQGEQLDSDVDSAIDDDDNTIPYHQYQLNNEIKSVPTDVSSVIPGGISVITILDDLSNMKEVSVDPNLSTLKFQGLETENTQLKEELAAVRINNNSLRDENMSIKKRYQDLYKSKAESNSNVSSGAAVSEKPKVLAPGLYAMTPKYVLRQKRNNKEVNTPLPRNEKVSSVKKPNVPVYKRNRVDSTEIKYATKASKSKSKCATKTHRNFPARSKNVKRVENPLRNLNKRNRVDSSLSVKRTRFISKSVSVCKTCNECLVFSNHDKCGVKNLNSVNAKNLKVKNDANVKQVWKATGNVFASVGNGYNKKRQNSSKTEHKTESAEKPTVKAMSTQQDIYAAGSESRHPMLNKENYVPWSSRLLRYAKSRPNGKLIHNSILNGPYVRRMIAEPGDGERDVNVNETFHEQTDDELSERELKQIKADDQAI